MGTTYWLILFAILMLFEAVTVDLTTIWFAIGALVGLAVSAAGGGLAIQLAAFLVVSVVLLLFTRPFIMKFVNKNRTKTNIDELPGTQAVVTEEIDGIRGTGRVQLRGMDWKAAPAPSEGEKVLPKGTLVRVESIEGVKVLVKKIS
ncbi:MAG: NfeD family protein [Eubacteriales bacterium]|nr:NfeD family protein [Eubacteriales bacterium]